MKETRISAGAKLAYARLARFAGKEGESYPSYRTLGQELGASRDRAMAYVRELEEADLIVVLPPDPGRRKSATFVFVWHSWMGDSDVTTSSENATGQRVTSGENTTGQVAEMPPVTSGGSATQRESDLLRESTKRGNDIRRKRRTPLPDDFSLTRERDRYARGEDVDDPDREFRKFVATHRMRGTVSADWDAQWQKWCLDVPTFNQRGARFGECEVTPPPMLPR